MKTLLLLSLTAFITTPGLLACTAVTTDTIPPVLASGIFPPKKTMEAFKSEAELVRYFRELAEKQRREQRVTYDALVNTQNAGPAPSVAKAEATKEPESVTNTRHAGVDEGGIVKVHGDHVVVVRRGCLFTVAIVDVLLKPLCSVDAFAPFLQPCGAWYDEILVPGD